MHQHFARLEAGCQQLKIPFPDHKLLNHEARSLSRQSSRAVLKLIITRGVGGRGYRQPSEIKPSRVFSLHPFPEYPDSLKKQGVKLRFCHHRLGINPDLAGIKHLNRLEQVLARSEWHDPDIHEGLMLDVNNYVIEGTMTNLFIVKGNRIVTPKLDQCGVAGIVRREIVKQATIAQYSIEECQLSKQDVFNADEVFLTNSIIGIWPVKSLETKEFLLGPAIRVLINWLEKMKQLDIHKPNNIS